MQFQPALTPGVLIRRYKRFFVEVQPENGDPITAHVAATGAMTGCSTPGSHVMLSFHPEPTRKLAWSLELVEADGAWVVVNTALPNRLVAEAVQAQQLPELTGYPLIRREVRYGHNSRIDLHLSGSNGTCFVEIKCVTLKEGTCARFPDAVTERGTKHLRELAEVAHSGARAVMLFLVVRQDCTHFSPADSVDPLYGQTLRAVAQQGVELLAYAVQVSPQGLELAQRLPVML
ncbi:MAG: DNA/RNA nuclease SfsA [Myxococcota bacterium]